MLASAPSSESKGFSQIPHGILTALAAQALSGGAFQVVLTILYELYRWKPDNVKPKALGARHFQQTTSLTRRTVQRAIKELKERRIIAIQGRAYHENTYSLNRPDRWRAGLKPLTSVRADASTGATDDATTSVRNGRQLASPTTPLRNKGKNEERPRSPEGPALSSPNGNGHKATPGGHLDLLPAALASRWYQQGEQ